MYTDAVTTYLDLVLPPWEQVDLFTWTPPATPETAPAPAIRHGSEAGYRGAKCRCEPCKAWKRWSRLTAEERRSRPLAEFIREARPVKPPHTPAPVAASKPPPVTKPGKPPPVGPWVVGDAWSGWRRHDIIDGQRGQVRAMLQAYKGFWVGMIRDQRPVQFAAIGDDLAAESAYWRGKLDAWLMDFGHKLVPMDDPDQVVDV